MITAPKRYFVAQTKTSERICICRVEELAALLNAGKIGSEYVAREWTGPSRNAQNEEDVVWVTIAERLRDAYKNKPVVTVILKDVVENACVLCERYHSEDGPWQVALRVAEDYFDQHLKGLSNTPLKAFQIYFQSDRCPPSVVTFKLKVESHTVYRGVIGSQDEPADETFLYRFVDLSDPQPANEFPSASLEQKPVKYDPTALLP